MSVVMPLPPQPTHTPPHSRPLSPLSRPHSPNRSSRPNTPGTPPNQINLHAASLLSPLQPISAPSTPVTSTHVFHFELGDDLGGSTGMERCRSSEAAISSAKVKGSSSSSSGLGSKNLSKEHSRESTGSPKIRERGAGGIDSGRSTSRSREPKTTGLLFKPSPSKEQLADLVKPEWKHIETTPPPPPAPTTDSGSARVEDHSMEPMSNAEITRQDDKNEREEDDDKMDVDEPFNLESSSQTASAPPSRHEIEMQHVQPLPLTEEDVAEKIAVMEEEAPQVWGMPKWGWEEERKEVRRGVRLVGMEELPALIEQHNLLDVPSHVMFPWLHGIADDDQKGRDMAAFFGYAPPFEPPSFRGLSLLLAPSHPLDSAPTYLHQSVQAKVDPAQGQSSPHTTPLNSSAPHQRNSRDSYDSSRDPRDPRERSETMSTSSESYVSSNETDITSPSVADFQLKTPSTPARQPPAISEEDVQMHPCEYKKASPAATHDKLSTSAGSGITTSAFVESEEGSSDSTSSAEESEEQVPSCMLLNALHAVDIFDFPKFTTQAFKRGSAKFRAARLPNQINLRNLNIQQIKYSTVSDVILYAKGGVGPGVLQIAEMIAEAQEILYQSRKAEFYDLYKDQRGTGEGIGEPVKYGVWVVVEPFSKIEAYRSDLVVLDCKVNAMENSHLTDLFRRETKESRIMTKCSEVVEGFYVGNDFDVPRNGNNDEDGTEGGGSGLGREDMDWLMKGEDEIDVTYDLCVRASELCDMPSTVMLNSTTKKLQQLDNSRRAYAREMSNKEENEKNGNNGGWIASPATIALRNLLSPQLSSTTESPSSTPNKRHSTLDDNTPTKSRKQPPSAKKMKEDFVTLDCAGSCRTSTGQLRSLAYMTERVIELVYYLRKLVEGRDKSGVKRKVLVHCQDGYTESSIIVLSYIMSSLSCSLPEAYLHLQLNAKRSFFLYPSDKPLLRRIDSRLKQDRRSSALKLVTSPSTSSTSSTGDRSPPTTPTSLKESGSGSPISSRWKSWGFGSSKTEEEKTPTKSKEKDKVQQQQQHANTIEHAKQMLSTEEKGGTKASQDAKIWFEDRRFDGFPSRILDYLYLGNLEHAGNALMLQAIGITHVVSVGESLINCPTDCDPMYGQIGPNTLSNEYSEGRMKVLDLADIRDDGNDPLRPLIARACRWIEEAREGGGVVLVHCRVGVSRSASIVMAYMMQYQRMGLMDAYLLTRARRLNVLIQPNLRFFHELFGWEVELAREEDRVLADKRKELEDGGWQDKEGIEMLKVAEGNRRKILYSWPSFCRDLYFLNRRFLCN